ncbi:hypothetical protein BTA51_02980 [Hahella sp. CCB-MM4]|uniref:SDR family NAD(P)-dependent oxidoreductase n=1 Tax=Hahella sp. (strain CCB-MM4) TaxID=1926491 RepID=UPI000B9B08BE|nr:SDR family oxidoreductase [Hahella sp. CCB-MM4]OZG75362.1 hypothetical protein BTA51_02980 [Hahella sp. CCB-MM4]
MSVSEKPVIWITGCANGVGAQLVNHAISQGYLVVATDIDLPMLEIRCRQSEWPEDQVFLSRLDVRAEGEWGELYDLLMRKWARLDVLINNAGVIRPGFLKDVPSQDLDFHLDVNLKGVVLGSQMAVRHMLKTDAGHIINIASLAGVAPVPGLGFYSVSKVGVRAYSLILAQELAETGIDVTVLCPDLIKTAMYDLQLDYPEEAALTFSGGRALTVEEIAASVFGNILRHAPLEVALPVYRGWLARIANLLPSSAVWMSRRLRKKGRERILTVRQRG